MSREGKLNKQLGLMAALMENGLVGQLELVFINKICRFHLKLFRIINPEVRGFKIKNL